MLNHSLVSSFAAASRTCELCVTETSFAPWASEWSALRSWKCKWCSIIIRKRLTLLPPAYAYNKWVSWWRRHNWRPLRRIVSTSAWSNRCRAPETGSTRALWRWEEPITVDRVQCSRWLPLSPKVCFVKCVKRSVATSHATAVVRLSVYCAGGNVDCGRNKSSSPRTVRRTLKRSPQ